ncbi:MAG: GNAT family N-acetyltransferase [Thermomicrobia bacterium]|nr:GNAT family N-acetyltransferase [Thermomicrobia bacterium]
MGIERPFLIAMPDEWIGPRIIMRRYTEDDARPLFAAVMESQAHLRQWLPWANTYHSLDDAIEFVRRQTGHWALSGHVGMAIFSRADGTYLGATGFTVRSLAVPSFEIGYWLRQSAEGHGYMSEAVRLATTFLFDRLSAQRVFIRCDARNARSKAVAERLGFTFEGCHRRDEIGTGGIIRDTLVYALIPDEFAQVRKSWER